MLLRVICKSKDGKAGFCELVSNVKSIKPNNISLLKDPVEYTDRKGQVWTCEKESIVSSDCTGHKIVPAICKGVYKIYF